MADIIGPEYYVGPHRKIAQRIKDPFDTEAMEVAAKAMAPFVPANAVLVPAPDSTGKSMANQVLATAVMGHAPGTIMRSVVARKVAVPSSRILRQQGKRGLTVKQHVDSMIQVAPLPPGRPIVVIDNVSVEGNTINAIEYVLQTPVLGLVYAVAAGGRSHKLDQPDVESPALGARRPRRRPRLCVTGSRDYHALWRVEEYIMAMPRYIVIVHGGAKGVDEVADHVARGLGFDVEVMLANWARYGRAAGPIRNREMVATCDHLVAFWNGISPGTASAIEAAQEFGVEYEVIADEGMLEG